jgi:hypothetical protein
MKNPKKESVRVRPPYKASAERQLLVEAMLKVEIGQELSYQKIGELIGEVPQGARGQAIIQAAKKHLRDEHKRLFSTIRNIGLKRLSNGESLDHAQVTLTARVRSRVKAGTRELQCVIAAKLPSDERITYDLVSAFARTSLALLSDDSWKLARQALEAQSNEPEVGKNVFKLFEPGHKEETG